MAIRFGLVFFFETGRRGWAGMAGLGSRNGEIGIKKYAQEWSEGERLSAGLN
jgi:hypothetical protein